MREAVVLRRQEAMDELERRDAAGFARWLAAAPGSDPADYIGGRALPGSPAAETDARLTDCRAGHERPPPTIDPAAPVAAADVAQLVAHPTCNRAVRGSSPLVGSFLVRSGTSRPTTVRHGGRRARVGVTPDAEEAP